MIKHKATNWLKLAFGVLIILFFSPLIYAEEVEFTVKPEFPENQLSDSSGFYDLKVSPGDEQELMLRVSNKSEKDITTKLEINPAATGESGGFIYTLKDSDRDDSMKVSMADIATTVETISIPAKGEGKVGIKLKIPKEPFEGIILGGIRVRSVSNEDTKEKPKEDGFSVSNTFAYTIAIRLQEQDTLPPAKLLLKSVQASQVVGRNSIKATLQNPTPTIIDKVSYHGQVMKKGQDKVLHETKVEGYRVAPNTNFDFPISWDNQEFEAGTYRYKLSAKSEETSEHWEFDQEFTISPKEAKVLNESAVDLEKNYGRWVVIGAIVLGLIVLILILTLILINRKKRSQRRKRMTRGVDKNLKKGSRTHEKRRRKH